ncbi:unnamed protein product [Echinostoma caproni]|uniref:Cytoplasmic tRNA 2-thiolation protein 2 n=1 Tax=Echinostoma caproni TaxID=27848 RepID=A0A183B3F1_9TREM|nr:unnamed protein product [Echinostoma caproni]
MCSTEESCECTIDKRSARNKSDRRSKCIRCAGSRGHPALVIRSDDPALCKDCFIDGCVHKFKSAFGKSQLVPNGSKVAVAFSGGLASLVMLDLIQRSNVRFTPVLFHLVVDGPDSERLNHIRSVMSNSGLENHLMDPVQNRILTEFRGKMLSNWTRSSLSEFSELDTLLTKLMLVHCARKLGCEFILLGACGTQQAVNFLDGIISGRGSSASSDTMFVDRRYGNPVVLRPLFEFMSKELVFYARFRNLCWISPIDPITQVILPRPGLTTLPRLCEDFLIGLQYTGFPSTTQTILSGLRRHFGGPLRFLYYVCKSDVTISGVLKVTFIILEPFPR